MYLYVLWVIDISVLLVLGKYTILYAFMVTSHNYNLYSFNAHYFEFSKNTSRLNHTCFTIIYIYNIFI